MHDLLAVPSERWRAPAAVLPRKALQKVSAPGIAVKRRQSKKINRAPCPGLQQARRIAISAWLNAFDGDLGKARPWRKREIADLRDFELGAELCWQHCSCCYRKFHFVQPL